MKIIKTDDGLDTIYSKEYNQTYHSKHGAFQEAQHVFLEGSAVLEKFQAEEKVAVLEIGFGTGFNFFLTAREAQKQKAELTYYAVENDLLSYNDFSKLNHQQLFSDDPVRNYFLNWRKDIKELKSGIHEIVFKNIRLILICSNALHVNLPVNYFDAVYLDAFSPDVNPELWTSSFFLQIRPSMKPSARLSTYSAKGSVKRALQNAGFVVHKQPGPKGKREMLVAIRP
jgi:tRNA U34 5-methylaminomethyl-2-thiouridine-forming methyltransferase MnmC